jgi:hypothetical protein
MISHSRPPKKPIRLHNVGRGIAALVLAALGVGCCIGFVTWQYALGSALIGLAVLMMARWDGN